MRKFFKYLAAIAKEILVMEAAVVAVAIFTYPCFIYLVLLLLVLLMLWSLLLLLLLSSSSSLKSLTLLRDEIIFASLVSLCVSHSTFLSSFFFFRIILWFLYHPSLIN